MRDQLLDMCLSLRVNVVAYDYTGYGCATGTPSEPGTYRDILAVYNFITDTMHPGDRIIVYGQSGAWMRVCVSVCACVCCTSHPVVHFPISRACVHVYQWGVVQVYGLQRSGLYTR